MHGSYLGPEYAESEIKAYLDSVGATYERLEPAALTERVAACTAVPGGVGPMTINTLILQTVQTAERALG